MRIFSCRFCKEKLSPDPLRAFEWPLLLFFVRPWCCPHCKDGYFRPAVSLRKLVGESERRFTARRSQFRGWGGSSKGLVSLPAGSTGSRHKRYSEDRYEKLVPDEKTTDSIPRSRRRSANGLSIPPPPNRVRKTARPDTDNLASPDADRHDTTQSEQAGQKQSGESSAAHGQIQDDDSGNRKSIEKKTRSLTAWKTGQFENAGKPQKLQLSDESDSGPKAESSQSPRRMLGESGSSRGNGGRTARRPEVYVPALPQQRRVNYASGGFLSRLVRRFTRRLKKMLGISRRKRRSSDKTKKIQRRY